MPRHMHACRATLRHAVLRHLPAASAPLLNPGSHINPSPRPRAPALILVVPNIARAGQQEAPVRNAVALGHGACAHVSIGVLVAEPRHIGVVRNLRTQRSTGLPAGACLHRGDGGGTTAHWGRQKPAHAIGHATGHATGRATGHTTGHGRRYELLPRKEEPLVHQPPNTATPCRGKALNRFATARTTTTQHRPASAGHDTVALLATTQQQSRPQQAYIYIHIHTYTTAGPLARQRGHGRTVLPPGSSRHLLHESHWTHSESMLVACPACAP
eukprot:350397-Chlamydomonas_euryale.AAC.2